MAYEIERHHGSYNISRRSTTVKYIVVHYTGSGTSAAGSALANCKYFAGGNRNASANYFVDDTAICEYADPRAYYTWHVGDGRGKYGISNSNSIGIEVCQNGDRPYTEAEIDRLAWLVRKLMDDFGVPAERVVRHYDASRKACPYYYTPSGAGGNSAWDALHARITSGETEDDMQPGDVWNYDIGEAGQSGVNNAKAWVRLGWIDKHAQEVYDEIMRTDDGGTGDGSSGGIYRRICYIDQRVREMSATVQAQAAAIEALAKSAGADPEKIAKAVSDAVAEKLESIDLSVTVGE